MKFVPSKVTRLAAKQALRVRSSSPTLLFVAGTVGVVTTTVLACKATLKLEEVLDETQHGLDVVRNATHSEYSEDDRKQDKVVIYTQGVVKVAKLYAPSIALGAVSILCLTKSHTILTKRNAGLTAAYAAVDTSFRNYRSRVAKEFGEDKEREILIDAQEMTVLVEDKNGPKKVKGHTAGPLGGTGYARLFDSTNPNWQISPEFSLMFIRTQEAYANQRLHAYGHVLLNDVYDSLGLPRTSAGCVVGWFLDGEGDNYVDFGLHENPDRVKEFRNYEDAGIWLDFNVDGPIYRKISGGA